MILICVLISLTASSQSGASGAIKALIEEGDQFRRKGDVQQALQRYFSSLHDAEEAKDTMQLIVVTGRLGGLYEKYSRYQEAIPYLKRSYKLLHVRDSAFLLAGVSNSLAWTYIKIHAVDSAMQYAEEAVQLFRSTRPLDTLNYCISLESLGEIYSFKKRYDDAERTLMTSMELGVHSGNVVIQGFTRYGLALNAFNQGKAPTASTYILPVVPVAEKYASPELLADVYKLAYQVHDALHQESRSLTFLRKYMLLKERLNSEDIEKKAAIINANFEIQKKEDEVQLLSQQNAIQQLEIQQRSLAQQITVGAVIGLIVIAALIYNRIQSQRKFERKELLRKNEELEQARKVQLSLLPQKPHLGETFEVFGKMVTATEVGGDYFDFIKLEDHRMLIAFGDATGHGMTAGMMVTITKVALLNNLSYLKASNDVVPVARAINDSILSSVSVKGIGMALQLFLIDARRNTISMTSCGMPYPMVYDDSSKSLETILIRQPPLGFMRTAKIELTEVPFDSRHLLLLASDGILERFSPTKEEYGVERLQELTRKNPPSKQNPEALLDNILTDTESHAQGIPHHDDMTILCARRK